ncbi:phosphoribosylformylglycinamidine synthase subunit PurS [Synechococcus sp. W55.2]|uniref:phosphoribosylformylglycinamidine synthase subunit PurS n=1 Tax=Synechococcus sp. W55.2 TaxID=2964513 RepID=UPI0039C06409
MQFQAQIQIHLRPSVLDPAGAAVQSSLHQLGHTQVQQVRIGKHIQLQLEAPNAETAHRQVDELCHQLLANPVIETYQIQVAAIGG